MTNLSTKNKFITNIQQKFSINPRIATNNLKMLFYVAYKSKLHKVFEIEPFKYAQIKIYSNTFSLFLNKYILIHSLKQPIIWISWNMSLKINYNNNPKYSYQIWETRQVLEQASKINNVCNSKNFSFCKFSWKIRISSLHFQIFEFFLEF